MFIKEEFVQVHYKLKKEITEVKSQLNNLVEEEEKKQLHNRLHSLEQKMLQVKAIFQH